MWGREKRELRAVIKGYAHREVKHMEEMTALDRENYTLRAEIADLSAFRDGIRGLLAETEPAVARTWSGNVPGADWTVRWSGS